MINNLIINNYLFALSCQLSHPVLWHPVVENGNIMYKQESSGGRFSQSDPSSLKLIQFIIFLESIVMGQLLLPAIIIFALLPQLSLSDSKVIANPYLDSFRTGSVTLPMTSIFSTNQTFTGTYSSPLANTTALQCYSFLTSFDIVITGSYLDLNTTVLGCSSTSINMVSSSFGLLLQTVSYLTICNKLVGSPNFMALQLSASNSTSIVALNNLNTTGSVKFYSFLKYAFFIICINKTDQPLAGYGFKFLVNEYSSSSLNFSIFFQGNSKSYDGCYFNSATKHLVIIFNQDFFSQEEDTIIVSGSAKIYNNLTKSSFDNLLYSYSQDLGGDMMTIAGLSGFYFKEGGNYINFYFQQKSKGVITVNTTIVNNVIYFNYITFPTKIKTKQSNQNNSTKNNSTTNNSTSNSTTNNNTNNSTNNTNKNSNNNDSTSNNSTNNNSTTNNSTNNSTNNNSTNNSTNNNSANNGTSNSTTSNNSTNNSSTNNSTNNGTNNSTNTNNSTDSNSTNTNNTTPNNTTPNNTNNRNSTDTEKASTTNMGIIVGISVASVASLSLFWVAVCCCRKTQTPKQPQLPTDLPISSKDLITTNIYSQSPKFYKEICSICHAQNIQLTASCMHSFHVKCLKKELENSENCFICGQSLKNDKHISFCSRCKRIKELSLEEIKRLGADLQNQMKCEDCKGRGETQGNEVRSQNLDMVWLQYGMGLNDKIVLS